MKRFRTRILACALTLAMLVPGPVFATGGTSIGQGKLGGSANDYGSAGKTRYNTTKIAPDTDDFADLQVQGDTRRSVQDGTRAMYEFASGTLIVHGYGSTAGPADSIEGSDMTPGTIGGGVVSGGSTRKSWLDGFYPYIYNGQLNGPADVLDSNNQPMYDSHVAISASDIQYIMFDDLSTHITDDLGLSADRDHAAYGTSETDYVSGITEIAPYTFANLPNLVAVDFDATQIQVIGEYAFAGCPQLGTGTVKGKTVRIVYHDMTFQGSGEREIYNHDYTRSGCAADCNGTACTNHGSDAAIYDEKAGRIILPHNLNKIGEHAFMNCPGIQEYVIHEDNTYFVASAREGDWKTSRNGQWADYTNGVVYSDLTSTNDGLKETGYTQLRGAVMSDYRAVPEAYSKFWVGPFGETEPMPLEWYVKSWNPKDYISTLGATGAPPSDHYNWTQIEAAVNKAKAASGHVGTGTEVKTQDDSWKSSWINYLDTSGVHAEDYKYNENWWSDTFFNTGLKKFGYDRSKYGNSLAQSKSNFDKYMNGSGAKSFNTLYLYPEGHPDSEFKIFPGQDPADWDQTKSKTTVAVIAPFAFSNAKNLSTINMLACNELTTFGQGAFLNCSALTTVLFPEAGYTNNQSPVPDTGGRQPNYKLTRLADDMFSQCTKLTAIYNLDRDCGETYGLGGMEFADVDTQPGACYSTVREFGQNCFHKCLKLNMSSFKSGSYVKGASGTGLPDTLIIIGQSCFHTCKSLTTFNVHKNIEVIGDYAFSDCYFMSSVDFEDKAKTDNGGAAKDRIDDRRNGTGENKDRQFYISGGNSNANVSQALQLGQKTFEHCTSLSHLRLGSHWLIQPTTFEHDIYVTRIDLISSEGHQYTIYGYAFENGATGQDGSNPDRAGTAVPATESYFEDCAYGKGLQLTGTAWVKKPS